MEMLLLIKLQVCCIQFSASGFIENSIQIRYELGTGYVGIRYGCCANLL